MPEVHKSWQRILSKVPEQLRESLNVILDFPPESVPRISSGVEYPESNSATSSNLGTKNGDPSPPNRISALPITYALHKPHVEKSKAIIEFERQGSCSICAQALEHDGGILAVCPNTGCETVSHLTCLSGNFLDADSRRGEGNQSPQDTSAGDGSVLPLSGMCKGCGENVKWVDLVKELTLRMRGAAEVERLLKPPRQKKVKEPNPTKRNREDTKTAIAGETVTADEATDDNDNDDEEGNLDELIDEDKEEDEENELDVTKDDSRLMAGGQSADDWRIIGDPEDDDLISVASTVHTSPEKAGRSTGMKLDTVIEDSDWDDAVVID